MLFFSTKFLIQIISFVCLRQFYSKRAGKFIQFAEGLGTVRLNKQ